MVILYIVMRKSMQHICLSKIQLGKHWSGTDMLIGLQNDTEERFEGYRDIDEW